MKARKYDHDFINEWRDRLDDKYYWLQYNYYTSNNKPFHICAELSNKRNGHIVWPVTTNDFSTSLPISNIDFTINPPEILNQTTKTPWDYKNWHTPLSHFSGLSLSCATNFINPPNSYEEYTRTVNMSPISCIDIDIIEKRDPRIIGIEGTYLYKDMFDINEAHRLAADIFNKRLFHQKAHEIQAEYNFMNILGGELYFMIYHVKNQVWDNKELISADLDENAYCLYFKVDQNFINMLNKRDINILKLGKYDTFKNAYTNL